MESPVLIVPVQLDALVVNKNLLARDGGFRWWPYNYRALQDFFSPEPEAFDRQTGTAKEGIYLHWNLPRALRKGRQDRFTGKINYPLVPNRWLVVRLYGKEERHCKAWVIESDCPLTSGVKEKLPKTDVAQMSMYLVDPSVIHAWKSSADKLRNTIELDPQSGAPQVADLGVAFPLADGWNERTKGTSFLTAVAPGNSAFSIYYPHNVGVFSMYDDLQGVDKDTVSYLVTGWYSDRDDDILASWQKNKNAANAYKELLQELGWKLKNEAAEKATQSFYEGISLSIDWDRNGTPPANDPLQQIRDSGKLNVSLGNTTIDSFSALVGKQLEAAGQPVKNAKLLRAFQYDLLPLLNKVNGDTLVENRIRQEWFSSESGGTKWIIANKESDGDTGVDLTPEENTWLTELNNQQETFDTAINDLADLQWQLHATWWKLGRDPDSIFPEPPNVTNEQLRNFLDPSNKKGITSRLLGQLENVGKLKSAVPSPLSDTNKSPEQAFADGIKAFAGKKKLADTKVLKAAAETRHWKAANPVMTISGLEPSSAADPDEFLDVRLSTDIVPGFTCDGKKINAQTISKALPVINSPGIPPVCLQLLYELFFTDPSSATAISKASNIAEAQISATLKKHDAQSYDGTLPSIGLEPWSQSWEPIFVEWKVNYTHIPFASDGKTNWKFNGNDYDYSPQPSIQTEDRNVGGISLLSTHTQTLFRRRLLEYLKKYPDANLKQIDEWIAATDDWKFISQELTGFHDKLSLRDPRPFRRPGSKDLIANDKNLPVANLSGFRLQGSAAGDNQPVRVRNVPYLPNGETLSFHGSRNGQLYFERLAVYDKFGRMLWLIEDDGNSGLYDAKNFPLIRDEMLMPEHPVHDTIAAVVQLPPRLLQNAQLDFSFVKQDSREKIKTISNEINPVGGWIIPNHLSQSLLLYATNGTSLGEFRLFVQADGTKKALWSAPVNGTVNSPDELKKLSPLIYNMVTDAAVSNEAAFKTLLQVVDETLWTIDPLAERDDRNLSVLIGRPLALVRARLQLKLAGPPLRDTGWDATFNPPQPEFTDFDFDIRLGDQLTREDGLIGYFRKDNYSIFNSVVAPATSAKQDYVKQAGVQNDEADNFIRLKFKEDSYEFVTLLADPRAAVHAYSGILPVKQIEIPAAFTGNALRNMELSFRMGPILTYLQGSLVQGDKKPAHEKAITFPVPAEKNGEWSWWEKSNDGKSANGFETIPSFSNTGLKSLPNTLREGLLQLKIDISKDK